MKGPTEPAPSNGIIKSLFDRCTYAHVTLANSLQCLLISDPETDKSSASLDVHVGHLSDPVDLAGLAHFLEHLLFLGTAKYPGENEYSAWLTSVGGSSNAYTDSEHTNYYFDVPNVHLEPALDRFGQFFVHPLFDPNGTERELMAVDSEHAKNLRNDAWRFQQLSRSLSNPAHPWHQFGTGSKETLGGPNTRERLIQFYRGHYSSEHMRLVVYGRAATADMEAWVRSSFSAVPQLAAALHSATRFNPNRPIWQNTPVFRTDRECGRLIRMRSLKPLKTLSLQWLLPDQLPNWQYKPLDLISHCIGHEGPGSLLSYLKKKGWASALSSDSSDRVTGMELFEVAIECTEAGLAAYSSVIQATFAYIDLIAKASPSEWQRVYDEVKALNDMRFQYKEKTSPEDTAASLAHNAHDYPIEHVLIGPYYVECFKPALVADLLERFATKRRENFRVFIQSQSSDVVYDQVEPHYGTEYSVVAFDEEPGAVESGPPRFAFPLANPYMPSDFTIHGQGRPDGDLFSVPKSCPLPPACALSLWHHLDTQFLLPKSHLLLILKSTWPSSSAKRHACVNLWLDSLLDDLAESLYSASVCGYKYSLGLQPCIGLSLSVNGPSEKLSLLALDILSKWRSYDEPSRSTFAMMKEKYEQRLASFEKESPFRMATYYMNYSMTLEGLYSPSQILTELKELDYDTWRTEQTASQFWRSLDTTSAHSLLYMGNVKQESAIEFALAVQSSLRLSKREEREGEPDPGSLFASRVVELPEACSMALLRPVDNNNSAVETYYQMGTFEDREGHTLALLLDQLLNELFFDTLRTKETFGYFVRLQMREDAAGYGLMFLVQSAFEPGRIVDRIERFLAEEAHRTLRSMSDLEFARNTAALSAKLTERDRKLGQPVQRAWDAILKGHFDFSANVYMNKLLSVVKKEQVLAAFESCFLEKKRRMVVLMKSQLENKLKRKPEAEDTTDGGTEDEDSQESESDIGESQSETEPEHVQDEQKQRHEPSSAACAKKSGSESEPATQSNGSFSDLMEHMHLASQTLTMLAEAELKDWKESLKLLPIPTPAKACGSTHSA